MVQLQVNIRSTKRLTADARFPTFNVWRSLPVDLKGRECGFKGKETKTLCCCYRATRFNQDNNHGKAITEVQTDAVAVD